MSYTVSGSPIAPGSTTAELAGIDQATLQTWLLAAQTAMHNLTIGATAQTISYGESGSAKLVTYTRTNVAALRGYILDLQRALGAAPPRRGFGVAFGAERWGGIR